MDRSKETKNLNQAIAKAQSEFPVVERSENNPYYRSKFAPYNGIIKVIRPIISKYNLFVEHSARSDYKEMCANVVTKEYCCRSCGVINDSKATEETEIVSLAMVTVTTRVTESESGEWKESSIDLPCNKVSAHGVQAVISYAKRNNLILLLDIAVGDDDDGNEGVRHPNNSQQRKAQPQQRRQEPQRVAQRSDYQRRDIEPRKDDLPFDREPVKNNLNKDQEQLINSASEKDEPWNAGENKEGANKITPNTDVRTDGDRQKAGIVTAEMHKDMKAALKLKRVNVDKWKSFIGRKYGIKSITEVKLSFYRELLDVIRNKTEQIMEE